MSLQENTTNLRKILNAVKKLPSAGGGGEEVNKFASVVDKTVTEITAEDLAGVTSIGRYAFSYCSGLTSIEIPDSITSIGSSALQYCTSLTSIVIPDSVVGALEGYTFYFCTGLTNAVIGNGITSIGYGGFDECHKLISVVIGSGVTTVASMAFHACQSMKRVDFSKHTTVPKLENKSAFTSINGALQIKVPANLIDSWKTATNWSNYAARIVTEFTNEL